MPRSPCTPGRCIARDGRRTCSTRAPGTSTREGTTRRTGRSPCTLLDRWLHYLAVAMSFFRSLPLHLLYLSYTSIALKPALPLAIFVQLVVKLGMSNLNKGLSPLANVTTVQVGDSVLGDHVVHVAACSEHARAMRQARHDA